MGREVSVAGAIALELLLQRLEQAGAPAQIVMIDGALTMPGARAPRDWGDVRVRTPGGTLALKRDGDRVAVVVFGNADEALLAMQAKIAALLAP
jgi:hypothetical protein